jgi:hypothetical protein
MAGEQAMAQAMLQPGASQVIGHRFLAEQKALDAKRDYTLATEQHDQTLADMREEDRRRALEDQATRNRHALITAGINNPAGMSASAAPEVEGLIDPAARDLYRSLLRENVAAAGRRYSLRPEGSGEVSPNVQANIDQRNAALIERSINAARTDLTRRESAIMADAARRLQTEFNQARRQAIIQERDTAIASARQRANDLITGLEAQRRGGGRGNVDASPQGNAQASAPPTQEQTATLDNAQSSIRELRLQQAREALARGAPRSQVEQVLRQQGIDPGAL